jgi:hypothetical protein
MKGDSVAVVQLTVLDRQRFLDNFHVLLSNLNVPQEARGANTYGERKDDYYAVYVEAGEGRFEDLMAQLKKDMDIEQMYVSTTIPSADLNSYVAEQGYSNLSAMNESDETDRKSILEAEALRESGSSPAAEKAESNRPARTRDVDAEDEETDSDAIGAKKTNSFRRSIAGAELPPPPPLPLSREYQPSEPVSPGAESAPAQAASPMKLAEGLEDNNEARQIILRLPESVGKRLIAPQAPSVQLSMSNEAAAGRQIEKQKVDVLRQQLQRRQGLAPSADPGAAALRADKPSASKPEPDETKAALTSPRPDAAFIKEEAENRSLAENAKRDSRRMQVLFLLTADTASATQAIPSSRRDAKPAPQN